MITRLHCLATLSCLLLAVACNASDRGLAASLGVGAEVVDSRYSSGSKNTNFALEYQFTPNFSLEYEQIQGEINGQIEVFSQALIDAYSDFLRPASNGAAFNLDYRANLDTQGLFLVYRTNTIFYGLLKVGMVKLTLDAQLELLDFGVNLGGDENYTSGGLGVGVRLNKKLLIESEVTYIDEAGLGFLFMGARYLF